MYLVGPMERNTLLSLPHIGLASSSIRRICRVEHRLISAAEGVGVLILSTIALGFAFEMHLESRLARYQLDSHTAGYLTQAGTQPRPAAAGDRVRTGSP